MNIDSNSVTDGGDHNHRGDARDRDPPNHTKHDFFEWFKVLITPIVVALASAGVTWYIGTLQADNRRLIAEAQRESAETIAEARRRAENIRAEKEQKLEELRQIIGLFEGIIEDSNEDPSDEELKAIEAEVASFQVYRDTAIPFLRNIERHFTETHNNTTVATKARETIKNILNSRQTNLRNLNFKGSSMRFAKFDEYNLIDTEFINTNLYSATFKKSDLENVCFEDADLEDADFSFANLRNVEFQGSGTRLTNTNFSNTLLAEVNFGDSIVCLEKANFSLLALMKVEDGDVFEDINNKRYARLLSHNYFRIDEEMSSSDKDDGNDTQEGVFSTFKRDERFSDVKAKVFNSGLCNTEDLVSCLKELKTTDREWCG